jgi:hydrogenase maturation protease
MKILILGAGNLLLSDEGFGVHFIRYLQEHYFFAQELELLDAGTMGIMITHRIEEADRVYIVDTLGGDSCQSTPGTCRRYAKEDFLLKRLPLKLSPHQAGVQEMLLVSELRGRCPKEIFLLGVIPASLAPGTELSPLLRQRLGPLAEELAAELRGLGISVSQLDGVSALSRSF